MRKSIINGESKNVISEYKKYIGQLQLYLAECETLDFKNLDYNTKQLQQLFNNYNSWVSAGSEYSRNVKRDKIDLYATVGVSFSDLVVDNNNKGG